MDTGTVRGIITGVLMVAFIGIVAWAYSRRRKPDFDEAANLPFADEDDGPSKRDQEASRHQRVSDSDARWGDSRDNDSRDNEGDKNV